MGSETDAVGYSVPQELRGSAEYQHLEPSKIWGPEVL